MQINIGASTLRDAFDAFSQLARLERDQTAHIVLAEPCRAGVVLRAIDTQGGGVSLTQEIEGIRQRQSAEDTMRALPTRRIHQIARLLAPDEVIDMSLGPDLTVLRTTDSTWQIAVRNATDEERVRTDWPDGPGATTSPGALTTASGLANELARREHESDNPLWVQLVLSEESLRISASDNQNVLVAHAALEPHDHPASTWCISREGIDLLHRTAQSTDGDLVTVSGDEGTVGIRTPPRALTLRTTTPMPRPREEAIDALVETPPVTALTLNRHDLLRTFQAAMAVGASTVKLTASAGELCVQARSPAIGGDAEESLLYLETEQTGPEVAAALLLQRVVPIVSALPPTERIRLEFDAATATRFTWTPEPASAGAKAVTAASAL